MAIGRPVVSTAIGCDGLDVVDGPEEFAERIVRLLTDRALYQRIIAEAKHLAATKYDWDVIARQMLDTYSEVTQQLEPHN